MERLLVLASSTFILACLVQAPAVTAGETVLSTILTPDTKEKALSRQGRSYYYDLRYGVPRPLYERLEYARQDYDRYDRPVRCGRCDDRYDDRDDRRDRDRDRDRDRYDDDRRSHKPTYGNKLDRNQNNYDDDDDRRYNTDRKKGNTNGNGTDDEGDDDKKRPYDDRDKDSRPSGSRRGGNRNRYDDRDRYGTDYYDRFLGDPYRERARRPYYEDPYRERRPLFDRNAYDDPYAGRYDGYGYPGYRRQYDDRSDDGYGGYGPGVGRGPHDSFRPWDETYRGQSGWDAGGRGYYFASGRPDAAPAAAWGRPEYARPDYQSYSSGWQNVGGYRDPLEYRGSVGYSSDGYRQDLAASYGQASGWHSVGERRPYRDQSGVNSLDTRDRDTYRQTNYDQNQNRQSYGQNPNRQSYGQTSTYGQPGYGQNSFGQNSYQSTGSSFSSSTTPQTSYLHEREHETVTTQTDSSSKSTE